MTDKNLKFFESSWLERLSVTPVWMPAVFWIPIFIWLMIKATGSNQVVNLLGYFTLGLLVWSFTEYLLHRFIFHFKASSSIGKKIVFIIHDNHHQVADDPLRGLFPVVPSAFIGWLYYLGFKLLFSEQPAYPLMAGFVFGYLSYDYLHFSFHHFNLKAKWWKKLRARHLRHHTHELADFGVSSPLWDKIIRTQGRK